MVVLKWLLIANIIAWCIGVMYILVKLTAIGVEKLIKWLKKGINYGKNRIRIQR